MKIIEDERAPNPRRVRIFLSEKGISVPFEQIDINTGEHKSDEVRSLNPLTRVPILVLDDGSAICESVAICRYFEGLQPEPALFGRTPREQAEVEMWNRRMELNLLQSIAQCFRHLHPAMVEMEVPQVPEWGEANRTRMLEALVFLNARLGESRFVAGDVFSIADITALVAVDFARVTKTPRPDGLDHLARWHGGVRARPSADA